MRPQADGLREPVPFATGFPPEMRCLECSTLLKQATGQLPRFLDSVYVLITFPLGKYRAIDRSADPKGKLQLTVL